MKTKVVIVTGAASGIGQATARRLVSEGAVVYAADINDVGETVDSVDNSGGGSITPVELDVRSADSWVAAVERVTKDHGGIDALANIAGVVNMISPDSVVDLTEEAWDHVLNTNLRGTWLGMKYVIPHMITRGGGRIVNISSMAAKRGLPNLASYSASKGGVIGLTQQAAYEYGDQGILVNAICPGTIDTPILGDITPEMKAANANAHIIKRLGTADELASMVVYLMREGSFLTGEIYPVDGGWSAKGNF
ncbi:SDR family NAD(P)-dependent oxidoreductase [Dietzia maris]